MVRRGDSERPSKYESVRGSFLSIRGVLGKFVYGGR